jgi:hypothetical protein
MIRTGADPEASMRSGKVLALSATVATGVVFVATVAMLSSLFQASIERGFDRRLGVHINMLVAALPLMKDGKEERPQFLGDALFELPLSGWYWQITPLDRESPGTTTSKSLWNGRLPQLSEGGGEAGRAAFRHGYVHGPEDQRLRLLERTVDFGAQGRYLLAVAGDSAEIEDQVRSFQMTCAAALGISAILLVLALVFQARFMRGSLEQSLEAMGR